MKYFNYILILILTGCGHSTVPVPGPIQVVPVPTSGSMGSASAGDCIYQREATKDECCNGGYVILIVTNSSTSTYIDSKGMEYTGNPLIVCY